MFSSKSFIVLAFTFRSLIDCDLIFIYRVRWGSNFFAIQYLQCFFINLSISVSLKLNSNVFSFIFDFSNWNLLSIGQSSQRIVDFVNFFSKNQHLVLLIFPIVLFFLFSFILIFVVILFYFFFRLFQIQFSVIFLISYGECQVIVLKWTFFNIYITAISLLICTPLDGSHKFLYIVHLFQSSQSILEFSFSSFFGLFFWGEEHVI